MPAAACFAASKLVGDFYWGNKWSNTSKVLASLRCLGRLGHQGDLQTGEQPLMSSAPSLGAPYLAAFLSHPKGAYLHPYELYSKEQRAIPSHAMG